MKTASSLLLISLFSLCSLPLYARTPLYSFTPNPAFPPTVTVGSQGIALVEYQITNHSKKTHTLKLQPINGITQLTDGGGACNDPFVLAGDASCTLSLEINGAIFNPTSGQLQPVVCQQGADGNPSPYQCYRPAARDLLNITITRISRLTISPSNLTLSVSGLGTLTPSPNTGLTSGQARTFTITNQGPDTAINVVYSVPSPGLPSGTTLSSSPSNCSTLTIGSTCAVTITPGAIASDAPGDTAAEPLILVVSTNGIYATFAPFEILTWGSVYQEGYVFAINETANLSSNITGKVAMLTNGPTLPWERNSNYNDFASITNSTSQGKTDGVSNTAVIVNFYGASTLYAAGWCDQYTTDTYANWYLPAMCETSYSTGFFESNCGTVSSPTINNFRSNLVDLGYGNNIYYTWTSTAVYSQPYEAWNTSMGALGMNEPQRSVPFSFRCVRAF